MTNGERRVMGITASSYSSLVVHHSSPPYLSLPPQPVKLFLQLLGVAARLGGVLAALRELEVLERGDDLGALERAGVAAFDVGEAEVVVRVGAAARGRGAELFERGAAVRRPELDAAAVALGGRGRGRRRGRRAGLRRRLRRGGRRGGHVDGRRLFDPRRGRRLAGARRVRGRRGRLRGREFGEVLTRDLREVGGGAGGRQLLVG